MSPQTLAFYSKRLSRAGSVVGLNIPSDAITAFLGSLKCTGGGKHSYWRALSVFYHWLYSNRSGYRLNSTDNPMEMVQPPKVPVRILPSLTESQLDTLIGMASRPRDRAILSLLFDSGIRISELCGIRAEDIDWPSGTVRVIGKGNKQRRAPFTSRTETLLRAYLADNHNTEADNVWGIHLNGMQKMLRTLRLASGIWCSAHSFRRGFACDLHRKGLSPLDIQRLGGWSDMSMVQRYTRSIGFEDSLQHYRTIFNSTCQGR